MLAPLKSHFSNSIAPQVDGLLQDNLARAAQFRGNSWDDLSSLVEQSPALSSKPTSSDDAQVNSRVRPQARPGGDTFADSLSRYGFDDNVPRSLIGTESSGDFSAENGVAGSGGKGHFGILQFSQGRLEDAKRAGVIPSDMTPQQFKASKEAQVNVSNWHFDDIDRRIQSNGYDRYLGQNLGGTPITMNGMRAIAHLGGFGGLSKFLTSGGSYNPADAYGTSLSKYGRVHASN